MKKRVLSIMLILCYLFTCLGVTTLASEDIGIIGPSTLLKPMDTSRSAIGYTLADSNGDVMADVVWSATEGLLITNDGIVILDSSTVNSNYTIIAVYNGQTYTKTVTVQNGQYNDFSTTEDGYVSTANYNVVLSGSVRKVLDDYTLEFDFNYPNSMDGYAVYLSTRNSGDWSVPILLSSNSEKYKLAVNHYENGVTREQKTYVTSKNYGEWSNIIMKSKYVPASDSEPAYAYYDVYSDKNLAIAGARPANSVASPYNGLLNFTIRQAGFCVDNLKIYSGDTINPEVAPYKYYGVKMSGITEFGVPRTSTPITSQFELENIFNASVTDDASWSVSPDNLGVSINDSGLLTVTNSAVNGTYAVTASVGGKDITCNVSVDSVDYNLTITGNSILEREHNFVSQDIHYMAGDQFGTPAQSVIWKLKENYTGVSVNESTGVVTVTSDACDGDYVICATASDEENFDTKSAEYVLTVLSRKYELIINGAETIYISEESLPCIQSYGVKLQNISDESDVYDIAPEELICSVKDSPASVSFLSGDFTLNSGAVPGIYTLNIGYGNYSASIDVIVKKLSYTIDGPLSLTAPGNGYRAVSYALKSNSGDTITNVNWVCSGAEVLADGRLLICADTPSRIILTAEYNGGIYTKEIDLLVGDAPNGELYERSITYSGTNKMSVSSGVNTKYLTASVTDGGAPCGTLPVVWNVTRVSDGLNPSDVFIENNILKVNGNTMGTVYVEGKISGTSVSTGEIAIELVNSISAFLNNTLTVTGTPGEIINVSHYAPADGNYIDAVLSLSDTPTVQTYEIPSGGVFTKQFDLSQTGMHKLIVNKENSGTDEYIVKVNDNNLFSQSNLVTLLAYSKAPWYHMLYSGASKELIENNYLAYTSLGAEAKAKSIALCDGTYAGYFASVYMAQLMEGNFGNTKALSTELQKAGYSNSWIELLLLDSQKTTICVNAFAVNNNIQSVIDSITSDVVLNGIKLSSKSLSKEARPYLAICGSTTYASLTDENKDKIASAVAGNTYLSLNELYTAIDSVKFMVVTPVKPGSSQQGTVSGGGGGGSSVGGGYTPNTPTPSVPSGVKYNDVDSKHWAYSYINALSEKGIINGYNDNEFRPENNISRAEFLKILVLAFDVPQGTGIPFDDVKSDAWYTPFISGAKAQGLVMGDGVLFNPDSLITRQEAATLIYRFAKYAGTDMPSGTAGFTDNADISDFALQAVQSLCNTGIINGMPDGRFAPLEYATRSQAAKMIYTIMEKGGKK